jgi:murein DD-endopeptidase MepM/ murein hydrolase activator NlpD
MFVSAPGPIRFDPPAPRLGDLVLIYVKNDDASVKKGALRIFGYEFGLFRSSPEELRAIVGIPLDAEIGEHDLDANAGGRSLRAEMTVHDREFESSELSVGKQFTAKKSKALLQRLRAEERAMRALFEPEPAAPRLSGPITRPVEGIVTALFGTKRVFNGKTNSRHYGLDLDGKVGDPIVAAQDGRVVMSAMRWASGGTIVIDHGGGLFTAYFHMSRRDKVPGDRVKAGEVIGAVGKTGRVTGPHLHLAVMVRAKYFGGAKAGDSRSLYVDPALFLDMQF